MADDKNKQEDDNKIEPFIHEDGEFRSAFFGPIPDKILDSIPQKFDKKLIATLISQLTDPNAREIKDEVFHTLKAGESQELLVDVIAMKEYAKHRKTIVAACWESGLDFTKYFSFFIELAINSDYAICLEAMTVITENMIGPFPKNELEKAKEKIAPFVSVKDERQAIFTFIMERLNAQEEL